MARTRAALKERSSAALTESPWAVLKVQRWDVRSARRTGEAMAGPWELPREHRRAVRSVEQRVDPWGGSREKSSDSSLAGLVPWEHASAA